MGNLFWVKDKDPNSNDIDIAEDAGDVWWLMGTDMPFTKERIEEMYIIVGPVEIPQAIKDYKESSNA